MTGAPFPADVVAEPAVHTCPRMDVTELSQASDGSPVVDAGVHVPFTKRPTNGTWWFV